MNDTAALTLLVPESESGLMHCTPNNALHSPEDSRVEGQKWPRGEDERRRPTDSVPFPRRATNN